ncbi:MAG: pre-peptidase C-terminal domain-containing protein [Fimbriimonadales bacterium]|nr:pre-peptidase C-terminal domain-containing protein [Fimbriimonadales bacterium]
MRKAVVVAALWATLACALAQIEMIPYLEREPNDRLETPQIVPTVVNRTRGFVVWEARVAPVRDRDFYRFQVSEAGIYSIRVDTNLDTVVRLYDASGVRIAENDNRGNPDLPVNQLASGITRELSAGVYTVEVAYYLDLGRARYALRVFPGTTAPDYDPSEPNDTPEQAIYLGRLSGGEFVTDEHRFFSYGGGDVDVYAFTLDSTGQTLTIRTQTYVDTVLRVVAPNGQVYENDDSEWDVKNYAASEVRISLAPQGTYYVFVRTAPGWGGYYRLRVSAPLPEEIVLQDGDAEFRLRSLRGDRTRNPFNNADWVQNGRDHLYQMGWWYRIQGTHARELTLGNLSYYDQDRPNRAILAYLEPEGLALVVQYELKRTADGGSVLYADFAVLNFQFQQRTVHVFHYTDLDVSGVTTNFANWDGGRFRVEAWSDSVWLAALTPFTRWQVDPFPQVLDLLLNDSPDDLSNGTLPLEGDFAAALQWTTTLLPLNYRTFRVHYALNTNRFSAPGDTNRDGCVDDADLLRILFDFGSGGFLWDADVNGDGFVDDSDLLEVLFAFGSGCG